MYSMIPILLLCSLLAGCGTPTPRPDDPNQIQLTGTVVHAVTGGNHLANAAAKQRTVDLLIWGPISLLSEAIVSGMNPRKPTATDEAPVYRIRVGDTQEITVVSRQRFSVGDCVSVWYARTLADRRYFYADEAEMQKVSSCQASAQK